MAASLDDFLKKYSTPTVDPNDQTNDYLKNQIANAPDRQALAQQNQQKMEDLQGQNQGNDLVSGILKNANLLGSVGGRVAQTDTSTLDKQNADRYNQIKQLYGEQAAMRDQSEKERMQAIKDHMEQQKLGQQQGFEANKFAAGQGAEDQRQKANLDWKATHDINMQKMIADREDQRQQNAANRDDLAASRKAQDYETRLAHELNFGPTRGGQDYQKQKQIMSSADRVKALTAQGESQPGGLDNRQIHEVAIAAANLVSGGTGAAQATVESLVPHSYSGSAAGIEEWLSGNPKGAEQQEFVKRMAETADREKHLATEKVRSYNANTLQSAQDFLPQEKYDKFKNKYVGNDAQFDENGNYIPKPYNPVAPPSLNPNKGSGMAIGAPAAPPLPKVGVVEDGHQFLGGDPSDPKSWKAVGP